MRYTVKVTFSNGSWDRWVDVRDVGVKDGCLWIVLDDTIADERDIIPLTQIHQVEQRIQVPEPKNPSPNTA